MDQAQNHAAFLIEQLLAFGLQNNMISQDDIIYTRNGLLDIMEIQEPFPEKLNLEEMNIPQTATPILEGLLDVAYEKGIISQNTPTYRDLLDTKIMGVLMPRPSDIIKKFRSLKKENDIKAATDYFYNICRKSDYIRVDRIARNIKWNYLSPFGELEITINLTKPEKDPKDIAALKNAPQIGYPKCALCPENVGYPGRINHPARQTLRTLPLTLTGEQWYFQYSPYVYYNQHCIVLYEQHVPMKITKKTFVRLLQFLDYFPHYFIGSNADLPIVGGSILNHDHFQGGYHVFPMEKAPIEYSLKSDGYPQVNIGVVKWPMSVLRLSSKNNNDLVEIADKLLGIWRNYSDPEEQILAFTKDEKGESIPHNTITPIARINKDGLYELDLVFRNNRTDKNHPMGIFHPHEELHHIKKENIGLIEVMGLFILPGRLQSELGHIKDILTGVSTITEEMESIDHPLNKHLPWIQELIKASGTNLDEESALMVIHNAVGEKCLHVLQHAGVFKTDEKGRAAFNKFLQQAGIKNE